VSDESPTPTAARPECACGEWRLTADEVLQGWHTRSEHDPACGGDPTRCGDLCPVPVACGPIQGGPGG
jgi:hypothetical protein